MATSTLDLILARPHEPAVPERPQPHPKTTSVRHLSGANGQPATIIVRTWRDDDHFACRLCPAGSCVAKRGGHLEVACCTVRVDAHVPEGRAALYRLDAAPEARHVPEPRPTFPPAEPEPEPDPDPEPDHFRDRPKMMPSPAPPDNLPDVAKMGTTTLDSIEGPRPNLLMNSTKGSEPPAPPTYRGVTPTPDGRWRARYYNGHQNHDLGTYATPEQAARAYDYAVYFDVGDKVARNFPDVIPGPPRCPECDGPIGSTGTCLECKAAEDATTTRTEAGSMIATATTDGRRGRRKSQTGYIGVKPSASSAGGFEASVCCGKARYYVGTFDRAEDAARARDRKAIELQGEKAVLNFPDEPERVATTAGIAAATKARTKPGPKPKASRPAPSPAVLPAGNTPAPAPTSLRQRAELLGRVADLLDGLDDAGKRWVVEMAAGELGLRLEAGR